MNRKRNQRRLVRNIAEMAVAVPQVLAHRSATMALAQPSARDRHELGLMVSEKSAAFTEAWTAMALQVFRVNVAWTAAFFRAPLALPTAARFNAAALSVMGAGLVPIHRTAVANARRLSRPR